MRGLAPIALALAGCTATVGFDHPDVSDDATTDDPPFIAPDDGDDLDVTTLSAEDTERYLATIVQPLVGRVLSPEERALIARDGGAALAPVVEGWRDDEGLVLAARLLIENKLQVNGTRGEIDFGLPGNLASYLARNDLPWSGLLTADTCYDANEQPIACDTGAPFAAGVVVTRAYLVSRASRFNLTRASTMMRSFACLKYPMEDLVQPRIDKERLIPIFRATTPEEQTDPRASGGFGNGFACYTCHGQFSLHAQTFVKFDLDGLWHADASGEQDPDGELGRSYSGLMASHLDDPSEASSERSQMFGEPVENLREAAGAIAASPLFVQCAARNVLEHTLGLDPSIAVDPAVLAAIADRASAAQDDPSFEEIVVQTFVDPGVVRATLVGLSGDAPAEDEEAAP